MEEADAAEEQDDAVEEPKTKRQRSDKLTAASKKVQEKRVQLEKEAATILSLENKTGALKKADRDKLEKAKNKKLKFEGQLAHLSRELLAAEEAAESKRLQEEAKAEAAAQRAEDSKVLSEAGAMQLVTLRLKYQSRFDNSSDTADKIWPHIYEEYIKLVEKGELPASDRISLLTGSSPGRCDRHRAGTRTLWIRATCPARVPRCAAQLLDLGRVQPRRRWHHLGLSAVPPAADTSHAPAAWCAAS